ncbi:MAG: cupredoxin domain-containing protein [Patescibacteria group bacterium]
MKLTVISILVGVVLVGGAILFTRGNINTNVGVDNVSVVNGKQIIGIRAKGGYQPRKSVAQAGLPTILRFDTNGTFDCSSSVRIPSLGISQILPQSGATDIDLGLPQAGTLQGMCGMGMYRFELEFKS